MSFLESIERRADLVIGGAILAAGLLRYLAPPAPIYSVGRAFAPAKDVEQNWKCPFGSTQVQCPQSTQEDMKQSTDSCGRSP